MWANEYAFARGEWKTRISSLVVLWQNLEAATIPFSVIYPSN